MPSKCWVTSVEKCWIIFTASFKIPQPYSLLVNKRLLNSNKWHDQDHCRDSYSWEILNRKVDENMNLLLPEKLAFKTIQLVTSPIFHCHYSSSLISHLSSLLSPSLHLSETSCRLTETNRRWERMMKQVAVREELQSYLFLFASINFSLFKNWRSESWKIGRRCAIVSSKKVAAEILLPIRFILPVDKDVLSKR